MLLTEKWGAHLAEELDVVQSQEPLGVVHHHGLALGEIDETAHLLLEAVAVVLDDLWGHHGAHIGTAGGISDHTGAAADQGDGTVARHLQALHQAQGHEMSHMQAVRRGIESDIEYGLTFVDHFFNLFFIRHLGDQAAGD